MDTRFYSLDREARSLLWEPRGATERILCMSLGVTCYPAPRGYRLRGLDVLGGVALAAAIAFGFGAQNVARDIVERAYE